MDLSDVKIGFVGTGRMATALASGFVTEAVSPGQICGVDPVSASRAAFQEQVGDAVHVSAAAGDELAAADIVFLAVKPQVMESVLAELKAVLSASQLVVSIAAGISIARLELWLPESIRVIRVMPNTPCLVGQGASGLSCGTHATTADADAVTQLLGSTGMVYPVVEGLLDAVTGVSGSGPAYVFQFIEALSDGGVKAGLSRDVATRLAAQTVLGAATMVLQTGAHPAALKDAVTSPGGTTIAALHQLEQGGLRAAVMNAVDAAVLRSRELS